MKNKAGYKLTRAVPGHLFQKSYCFAPAFLM